MAGMFSMTIVCIAHTARESRRLVTKMVLRIQQRRIELTTWQLKLSNVLRSAISLVVDVTLLRTKIALTLMSVTDTLMRRLNVTLANMLLRLRIISSVVPHFEVYLSS